MSKIVASSVLALLVVCAIPAPCDSGKSAAELVRAWRNARGVEVSPGLSAKAAALIDTEREFYPFYYLKFLGDYKAPLSENRDACALVVEDARGYLRYSDAAFSRFGGKNATGSIRLLVSIPEQVFFMRVAAQAKGTLGQWDEEMLGFCNTGVSWGLSSKASRAQDVAALYHVRATAEMRLRRDATAENAEWMHAAERDCTAALGFDKRYLPAADQLFLLADLALDPAKAIDALDIASAADPLHVFTCMKSGAFETQWLSADSTPEDQRRRWSELRSRVCHGVGDLLDTRAFGLEQIDSLVKALNASYAAADRLFRDGKHDAALAEIGDMLGVSAAYYPAWRLKAAVDYAVMEKSGTNADAAARIVADVTGFFDHQDDPTWGRAFRESFPATDARAVAILHGMRGYCLVVGGRNAEAVVDADAEINAGVSLKDLKVQGTGYYVRGLARHYAGDLGAAESDYVRSVSLDPGNWWPHYYLTLIYGEKKDRTRTLEMLRRMVAIAPDYTKKLVKAGREYDWLRDSAELSDLLR